MRRMHMMHTAWRQPKTELVSADEDDEQLMP